MAQKYDILYVNFYTDGSAARKVDPAFPAAQPKRKAQTKARAKNKKITLFIDPVALCSMVVASVMLIMMAVGLHNFQQVRTETQLMEEYVTQLKQENMRLSEQYYDNLDMADIEKTSLALGMVPKDQGPTVQIQLKEQPAEQTEQTVWDQMVAFLTNLFA